MAGGRQTERLRGTTESQAKKIADYWSGYSVNIRIESFKAKDINSTIYCIRSDIGERMRL